MRGTIRPCRHPLTTTCSPCPAGVGLARVRRRPRRLGDGPARLDHRPDRRSRDQARPRRELHEHRVDQRGLHPRDGGGVARRRPARGHSRAHEGPAGRHGRVHGRVRPVRGRADVRPADRRPRPPGRHRRDHDPAGFRPHPRAVRRRRAAAGVRRLRTRDGAERRARTGARRGAGRSRPPRPRLADDLPGQRPHRHRRHRARPAAPPAHPARRPRRARGPAQRRHGHGGWCRARLSAHRGPRVGLARLVLRADRRRGRHPRRVRAPAAPLGRPRAAGRHEHPAPSRLRGRARPRRLLHRRDGRDDPRPQRDAAGGAGLLAPRVWRGHHGRSGVRDLRVDHIVGDPGAPRPDDHPHRHADMAAGLGLATSCCAGGAPS